MKQINETCARINCHEPITETNPLVLYCFKGFQILLCKQCQQRENKARKFKIWGILKAE